MLDKERQAELVDTFIEDLLQNPRIMPPAAMSLELAETVREMVLAEQHLTVGADLAAQKRIWARTLSETRSVSTQRPILGWIFLTNSPQQIVAVLTVVLVGLIFLMLGSTNAPTQFTSQTSGPMLTSVAVVTIQADLPKTAMPDQINAQAPEKAVFPTHNPRLNLIISREADFEAYQKVNLAPAIVDDNSNLSPPIEHHYLF